MKIQFANDHVAWFHPLSKTGKWKRIALRDAFTSAGIRTDGLIRIIGRGIDPEKGSTLRDSRYSVRKEFTGATEPAPGLKPGQRFVARFSREFIGSATTQKAARALADRHNTTRFLK
jgi:hypothetical protein